VASCHCNIVNKCTHIPHYHQKLYCQANGMPEDTPHFNSSDYEEILYQFLLIGLAYDYALMMLSNFKIMLTY
jgi:hypothetical protein